MTGPYLIEKYKKVFISWVTFSDFLLLPSPSCRGWHPESKCHSYKMSRIWVFCRWKRYSASQRWCCIGSCPVCTHRLKGFPAEQRADQKSPGEVGQARMFWFQPPFPNGARFPPCHLKLKGFLAVSVLGVFDFYIPQTTGPWIMPPSGYHSVHHPMPFLHFQMSPKAGPKLFSAMRYPELETGARGGPALGTKWQGPAPSGSSLP